MTTVQSESPARQKETRNHSGNTFKTSYPKQNHIKRRISPVQQSIDTGSEVPSVAVNAFILEMLDKARPAMDRFERWERKFSWITVGVSDEGFRRIVEEMRAFRLRVAEIVKESRAERVYQINMQAFPVTGKPRGRQ
jgi:uncharacterized protein (TIGR02147 family)